MPLCKMMKTAEGRVTHSASRQFILLWEVSTAVQRHGNVTHIQVICSYHWRLHTSFYSQGTFTGVGLGNSPSNLIEGYGQSSSSGKLSVSNASITCISASCAGRSEYDVLI